MNDNVPSQIDRMDTERLKGYRRLLDFYYGLQWEGRERRGERHLVFNYARVFIEKITSYLMVGISYAVEADGDDEKSAENAGKAARALYRVYEDNYLEQLDLETEIDGAVLGDACYKVFWDQNEKRVRVTAPDVQGIYAWWRGDDISRLWRVASRYTLEAEEAEIIYGIKPKNKTAKITEIWTDRVFELYLDNTPVEAKANPYGFIPFVIYPNLREPKKFWGISDLPQIMESQRELNRAMSQLSRILELSGNPIAVLENVEESEDIAISPGAVWNIPEDAKAYLLDLLQGGGVNLHINYIDLIYRALHDLSESPRSAFGGIERDISGVALEIDLQPLLQKVRRKRIIRAAAYKQNGDLTIFYADQSTLYVKKNVGGTWQSAAGWDKSTGDITGASCVYDGDWNLLLTGQDADDNFRLWSLVHGDGGGVTVGEWSDLIEIATAPAGENFEFRQPFLDKPDVYRGFFIEKFTGDEVYSRPYWSHTAAETDFIDSRWREPVPFDLTSEYGMAIARHGDYAWLTTPDGVWRTAGALQSLDLTDDVIAVKAENEFNSGRLTVELRNDDGRYAAPGEGDLAALEIGGQVEVSSGYITAAGNEYSSGPAFQLEGYEHTSSGSKASLVLRAEDGWQALENWKAGHQFRWNKDSDELNVKGIMAFVLARVGIKLVVISESDTITGFYPDITLNAGSDGRSAIRKLLSYAPDVIFIEGHKAYLVNPLPSDTAVYGYGTDHAILAGRYGKRAQDVNSVKVEGYDTGSQEMVLAASFDWEEIARSCERPEQIEDRNIGLVAEAGERGQAVLREAGMGAEDGHIIVPTNCGQQLTDVIEVTDSRAGLNAAKKRITGITTDYRPQQGEYRQRLRLGAV